ncbi:Uu.00g091300.m01.CDS01 [Anthostomella pinea]|uniref:Uu.00g091300.m01.CDS01 n=1 Tax=Anthostomella pinea TaxID=933095 RepID=A0AAI8VN13_9PEZI|nr:Uu.00g091300.m01.CDS01 [Anthostomella pinea]
MAPLLPTLAAHARSLLSTAASTRNELAARSASEHLSQLGPLAARSVLLARDDAKNADGSNKVDPSHGVIKPGDVNNTFVFVLFGLIGAGLVCVMIWFFFWAKNGGFYFKENDWDDYKTTVMRRRGPNGTLLSGATPSTNLGGGSVYKDVDDGSTEYTGGLTQVTRDTDDTQSTFTGITGGVSDFVGRERRRQRRERKELEKEKKRDRKRNDHRRKVGEDGALVDEDAEAAAKSHLRAYRHEKAARVGGINKECEGSQWDGSTNPDNSTTAGSDLLSNRQSTPTSTPTKKKKKEEESSSRRESKKESGSNSAANKKKSGGGIRKVYSSADRTADRENDRIRAEARRLAEKGRAAGSSRRDFSWQRADLRSNAIEEEDISNAGGSRYLPPGSYAESDAGTSELGTKSYHHVIPGLSSASGSGAGSAVGSAVGSDYAEERRKKRGVGRYRRGEE